MELIPEWAPNIHPLLVHFPIGIIILAILMDFLNFFLPDKWWNSLQSTILYGIGGASAVVTYYSGTLAADSIFLPSRAQSVLSEHADFAWYTIWFFGIYLVIRICFHLFGLMDQKTYKTALFLIALPGLFLLYETGDHGAKLVFGYGAGTDQLIEQKEGSSIAADSLKYQKESKFVLQDNGNWSWPIGDAGLNTFLSQFQWIAGGPQQLEPAVVENNGNHLLSLHADTATNLFVQKGSYQNVQVDYRLDISDFEGQLSLISHVQDANNYDFVMITSDGTITQGRLSNGKRHVFAEEKYSASGMLFLRTVVDGTHFRAYINREMAVHGHGEAPEAGKVGILIEGKGEILLDEISLTQL